MAEELLAFVAPTMRYPEILAAGRMEPLLHMTIAMMPEDDGDLTTLAIQALQEEINNHQQLDLLAMAQSRIDGA